jgi:hypothetical protein
MNTDITAEPINETAIRKHASELCELALPIVSPGGYTREIWVGKYGEVIVGNDGQHWIGDLCYMRERFNWTHDDYMRAYGYTLCPDPGWRESPNATRLLPVHTYGDKHILVINTGHDGAGPLGLGMDTGAITFVSTDRTRIEAAATACRNWLVKSLN